MAELKRTLGLGTLTALSITAMIGTGLFFGSSLAAKYAGPASILAWVFLALLSVYMAACFGELVSMYPAAGGVYEFAKRAYGRFPSFLIGWITWVVGNITVALLIVAALNYLIPDDFSVPGQPLLSSGLIKIGLAVLLIIVLNAIAYRGIEASSVLLNIFAVIGILSIVALVIPGLFHVDMDNFGHFWKNPNPIESTVLLFVALFFILESYFGWEAATFLSEETKNPSAVIPKALLLATVGVAVLGTLFAFITIGVLGEKTLVSAELPVNVLGSQLYPASFGPALHIAIFLALLGSAAGGIVSTPRLLAALARDKLFIDSLAEIHPKHNTPGNAIIFQTVISVIVVLIAYAEYKGILSFLVPLALVMYISVLLAVPILRRREPAIARPFRAPLGTVLPFFVSLIYVLVIVLWFLNTFSPLTYLQLVAAFMLAAVPIYLVLMFYYDPDFIVSFHNQFARYSLRFEGLLLPDRVKKLVFEHLKDLSRATVLEYGCGVGTLTTQLAYRVGPEGRVFATDLSTKSIRIAQSRIKQLGFDNVVFIHDIHQVSRVHHEVPKVDAIVSVGMLGFLQDIKRILDHMNHILPDGARLIFVEYTDLFKIVPKVSWLNHPERLVEIFRQSGFAVKVEKIKGPFWNFLIVYGIKSKEDVPFV